MSASPSPSASQSSSPSKGPPPPIRARAATTALTAKSPPKPTCTKPTHVLGSNPSSPSKEVSSQPAQSPHGESPTQSPKPFPESPPSQTTESVHVVISPDPNAHEEDLDKVRRRMTLKSAKDLVIRKSVTTSYGINPELQRPKTKVIRKSYAQAKAEREAKEAELEANARAAAEAEKLQAEQQETAATQGQGEGQSDDAQGQSEGQSDDAQYIRTESSETVHIAASEQSGGMNEDIPLNENDDDTPDGDTPDGDTHGGNKDEANDGGDIDQEASLTSDNAANLVADNTPSYQERLALNDNDASEYERLWADVAKSGSDTVLAKIGVSLFKPSKLGNKALRRIWDLCDITPPHGELTKDEFMIACKLIGLAQDGIEASLENLTKDCQLPRIGHLAADGPLLVTTKRPWLTKEATREQCIAAILESGDGTWIVKREDDAHLTLFANSNGVATEAKISLGLRGGNKCYMTSGMTFSNLNEVADKLRSEPELFELKTINGDSVRITNFNKPAVFSKEVAAMKPATPKVEVTTSNGGEDREDLPNLLSQNDDGDDIQIIHMSKEAGQKWGVKIQVEIAKGGAFVSGKIEGSVAAECEELKTGMLVKSINGKSTTGLIGEQVARLFVSDELELKVAPGHGLDLAYEETNEEKMARIFAEAKAKIDAAQNLHLENVRAYMNTKLHEEWLENQQEKGARKYDKKELKRILALPEVAKGDIYAHAVACVDIKHKEMKKLFINVPLGETIEVIECKDTPAGLWIARYSGEMGFVETGDIMINAQDVKRHHHGTISLSTTPSHSPKKGVESLNSSPNKPTTDLRDRSVTAAFGKDTSSKPDNDKDLIDELYESTDDES